MDKLGKLLASGAQNRPPAYYAVARDTRINYAVMYLGLAAFLAVMSYDLHDMLGH